MAASDAPARQGQPRWSRLQHDERRDQIFAAARRLFATRGFDGVSTSDIAREAGVSRTLLHHYFESKRALYLDVVRSLTDIPWQPDADADAGHEPEVVVRAAVSRWLVAVERNPEVWLTLFRTRHAGTDDDVDGILREAEARAAGVWVSLFSPGGDADSAPKELSAAIAAWGGLAREAVAEWPQRRRIGRDSLEVLLVGSLLAVVRDVVPQMRQAGRRPR